MCASQVGDAAGAAAARREPRTVLRYAVEVVLPRAARLLGLLEPVRPSRETGENRRD